MYSNIPLNNCSFLGKNSFFTRKAQKAITEAELPEYFARELDAVENPQVKEKIKSILEKYKDKIDELSISERAYIYDFMQKLRLCQNNGVKNQVESLIVNNKNVCYYPDYRSLRHADRLLDSVNILDGKYCSLYESTEIGYSPKQISYYQKHIKRSINKTDKQEAIQREYEMTYSEPYKQFRLMTRQETNRIMLEIEEFPYVKDFLIESLQQPQLSEEKAVEYLNTSVSDGMRTRFYENTLLKDLALKILKSPAVSDKEVEKLKKNSYLKNFIYKNIQAISEYDMKYIINSQCLKEHALHNRNKIQINDGFWRKYILSDMDPDIQGILKFIKEEFGTMICCKKGINKTIICYIREEMRMWNKACKKKLGKYPELIDINDNYAMKSSNRIGEFSHTRNRLGGTVQIPEIHIIKSPHANTLRHELAHNFDSHINIKQNKKLSRKEQKNIMKELLNGNIQKSQIQHAFIDNAERVAVSMESDIKLLSKEYVEGLKKDGLPDGIENIQDVSLLKCELMKKYFNPASWKVFDRLDDLINSNFTEELVKKLLCNADFKQILKICDRYKPNEHITPEEFIKLYETF